MNRQSSRAADASTIDRAGHWLAAMLLGLLCASVHAQMDYQLSFDTTLTGKTLDVVPLAKASQPVAIRYELVSQKSGRSGRSVTRQAGTAKLDGTSATPLSRLRLSVAPEDHYTVTLRIFEGTALVAEKTFSYPEEEKT